MPITALLITQFERILPKYMLKISRVIVCRIRTIAMRWTNGYDVS